MPSVLVIRLHPVEPVNVDPVTGSGFSEYLDGLTIAAHEVSFTQPAGGGPAFGTASYIAPALRPNPSTNPRPNHDPNNRITQHFSLTSVGPPPILRREFQAIATAVIQIPDAPAGGEFRTADIRLVITRGANEFVHKQIYYNVPVAPAPIPVDPNDFPGLQPISLHLALPSSGQQLDTTVLVPADGTAPNFGRLRQAVETVLNAEPGNTGGIADLTRERCKHIAYELIWDRMAYPLPLPKRSLEELYTGSHDPGSDEDRDRRIFEGDLLTYYTKHNNEADRLANFVFSLSAAIWCEQQSQRAVRVGFYFPAVPGQPSRESKVILTGTGPAMDPVFRVPAEYFYALTAILPPQVAREQRFTMVLLDSEAQTVTNLEAAIADGVLAEPPGVNRFQAARRFRALGLVGETGTQECRVTPATPAHTLITNWLNFVGADISQFWAALPAGDITGHLDLVLCAVTHAHAPLEAAIKAPPFNVSSAIALKAKTSGEWEALLNPNPALLPEFTKPGTTEERTQAFIRHLRRFFDVTTSVGAPPTPTVDAPPLLRRAAQDPLQQLVDAYNARSAGPDFLFGASWNEGHFQAALNDVFPNDNQARAWLEQTIRTIGELYQAADVGLPDELQFSVAEALYVRGFTSGLDIRQLSAQEFQEALTGTVAFEHASDIYENAGGEDLPGDPEGEGFQPINPDGTLTNCIPPPHLSPLGPVAYLHEIIKLSEGSTCGEPFPPLDTVIDDGEILSGGNINDHMHGRCKSPGDLLATRANLEIPLPLIDLVNECLEAVTAALPAHPTGAYNTASDELDGHKLRPLGSNGGGTNEDVEFHHNPMVLFEALPEHSSPATPVKKAAAYDKLKEDFTAPQLPYSQPLDICRSNLRQLRTSRYAVMRRFRKDITELVLDPANEPADFQRHLWRYPVRIEIAREYLGITPEEYELLFTQDIAVVPTEGRLLLREVYGFPSDTLGGEAWFDVVAKLSEFLKRLDLTYCEFLDLWKSEFVQFNRAGNERTFPPCEPCCLSEIRIEFDDPADPLEALERLAVFVRLWHKLQQVDGAHYTFVELRDICGVLRLFINDGINPDFIRQLAAFQMLRDRFSLALSDDGDAQAGTVGADRTHLLALWVGATARKWNWAFDALLDGIQQYAQSKHKCGCRPPEFIKLLADNLDPLSLLAGFDPGRPGDTWRAHPTHTLRFAEILSKIYASDFGIGEILFLFTVDPHLDGDDQFPLQPDNEALDSPLGLPDDEVMWSLCALRQKLLTVSVSDEEARAWTWTSIDTVLREEFGYAPAAGDPDHLLSLGEHFFPTILETCGCQVDPLKRQYRVDLDNTPAPMWNTPPDGPFRYDSAGEKLWTQLSLTDEAVIAKLSRIRQLNSDERRAVQELYFLPRVDLAPFTFLFSNFGDAEERLIQEPDEHTRWAYFQGQFALCYKRCCTIAEYLAEHVTHVAGRNSCEGKGLAWRLLKHLFADENRGKTSWEVDTGEVPEVTWKPQPSGGAFAALLGLTGTGLLGEFIPEDGTHKLVWEDDTLLWEKSALFWREVRGPMKAFGPEENGANCPIPTVLPAMDLSLTLEQQRYVTVRNGFALSNSDGAVLGGAQGFAVRWTGVLLVEHEGTYTFRAGAPTPEGQEPDFAAAETRRWRVTLRRGQKTWVLLSHHWPDTQAPGACSTPMPLRCGAYQLIVEFIQPHPPFAKREDVCPQTTGFQLKYIGPDTGNCLRTVPHDKLFRDRKDETLGARIEPVSDAAKQFLDLHFTSTLRDIRRTYQRAFKALLFAHRFDLSARPVADDGQSEVGYMFAHFEDFSGTSYFRNPPGTATFDIHKAHFDFNFLPLLDNYLPPPATQDIRTQPSEERRKALFDWWERIFDYTVMRREAQTASERPLWLLFHEAAEKHPDDPAHLLRHMGVDLRHTALELRYCLDYSVTSDDLEDERWAIRAWQGEKWIRALNQAFFVKDIREARPDLWASDDPSLIEAGETKSGNENLTKFVRDGCFENGEPRRYKDVKRLNDGLRDRARQALVAYLTGMQRVLLPWGGFATNAKHLSELLLLDVEAGLCQKASRIEEAVSAVQTFIQRHRLGLETGFTLTPEFLLLWDSRFAMYHIWETCKRREIYRENWVVWDELPQARRTESFRFLESELRRAALTVPVPGGLEYWLDQRPPIHPGLTALEAREPALIQQLAPPKEGFDLLGTPERHARPSWLAAMRGEAGLESPELDEPLPSKRLPFWVQAAIRLGVRFVRVAAAGEPPVSTSFEPGRPGDEKGCCVECGKVHPPASDEYYFWLMNSRYYDEQKQEAAWGSTAEDLQSDWHRKDRLPTLLSWKSQPMVHLMWCRVHNGELQQPGRSSEGVRITPGGDASLMFVGRVGDSLTFEVQGGQTPVGYPATPPPGFRYDIATDSAVMLPMVVAPPALPPDQFPGGLPAYPYFAYFSPGAPLVPVSLLSPAMLVAGRLRAHCRFEAALKWYGLVHDPLREDSRWCQNVEPTGSPVEEPTEGTACCQSGHVSDQAVKHRAVTLHYLETLMQWGDTVMRRHSPETFQQARVIFDSAVKVLGHPPQTILKVADAAPPQTVSEFSPLAAPLNPRLMVLYELVEDRLAIIHHCLNSFRLRNGRPNTDMPYWTIRLECADRSINLHSCYGEQDKRMQCVCEETCCCPNVPYRFQVLVQKSLDLANDVRGFGAALLAAYEKGDAEYLAALRVTHERQLLHLALEIRQNQWREADWQVQALQKTKEIAQTRLQYYKTLITNGLISGEVQNEPLTISASTVRTAGNVSVAIGQAINLIPDPFVGFPANFVKLPPGQKLSDIFQAAGTIANTVAEILNTAASLGLTKAGWDRREDEWQHQVDVLTVEIEQIERQILAAERRRDIALRELNNHQRQIEHASEVQEVLRDKFTNHALYLFLQQETAALHYQMFELALHTARQAQRAFNYERGHTARTFLPTEPWDNLHEGLLVGERLQLAVRQMEKAYLCENVREYELTKHISLRLHFPVEFLRLKATGYCEIEIPEWMFDLDYPGHYMRRIKNVTMTIPCVVGPYAGVHCRLTLLSSRTRVDPRLLNPLGKCCDQDHKHGPALDECCRSVEPDTMNASQADGDRYVAMPDDPRVVKQYAATEAIVTSSGQNDSGMFELNFRDERYLPFEFAGAVSRWRIELPPDNNQFDMETLSDVVLHLNYTAREGGDVLRRAANAVAQRNLPGDGLRFFDVKQEFPDLWQRFQTCSYDQEMGGKLALRLSRNMFPFIRCQRDLSIVRVDVLFEAKGAVPSAHQIIKFMTNDGHHYLKKQWHECDVVNVDCVASADWPCLFHGVLTLCLGPLCGNEVNELGTFMFPHDVGIVPRVFLICGYEVTSKQHEAVLRYP